ncbi:hypothetical protein QFZ23_001582 [Arthrobacter globiformis]|uniref:hypothetical protein n=1 Tax=Arthrobacter globiformis TaxID=1665 RepID=UPI00277E8064|nr:hypothetical protein [Arthrobacter globiformis]MDQ1057681.1 hypothetical protein [Arthrobacter globiformis]
MKTALLRFFGIMLCTLMSGLSMAGCGPDPTHPGLSSREAFARSVVAAAASGSVEQVEKMAPDGFVNVHPDAQHLVNSLRDWDIASVDLRLTNEFPEYAQVQALKETGTTGINYTISWQSGRWTLGIGTPENSPTGGAKPGIAGVKPT